MGLLTFLGNEVIGYVPRRGKQKAATKKAITVRFDEDILDAFKAQGKGWQTRMNADLREYLQMVSHT